MPNAIIDYTFDNKTVTNPDGKFTANFSDTNLTTGPGETFLGEFKKSLSFAPKGKSQINLTGIAPNKNQFYIDFCFKVKGRVSSRQNLFESTFLPFAIFVLPGSSTTKFEITSTVKTLEHGWSGPNTQFKKEVLKSNQWYVGRIVYDYDTLGLFIYDISGKELINVVHAFPNGTIELKSSGSLYIGTWTDNKRDQFQGNLAFFKWHNGLPVLINSRIDEMRNQPEWFISYKYESFKRSFSIGQKIREIEFDSINGSYIQHYDNCGIMYHFSLGTAFEMHGGIYAKYKNLDDPSLLGFLVSDESPTIKTGGRKSIFSKGAIYWSKNTGAIPVTGQIYIDYEHRGESSLLGFPTRPAESIISKSNFEQEFENGRMYHRKGNSNAHEVHGAILQKFLSSGGVRKWGFPITDEMSILKNNRTIGRFSEFEKATIYWKRNVGAFIVSGDIREKYLESGGPLSDLGFPTSDEQSFIAGSLTRRLANTFEKGAIIRFRRNDVMVALPFRIYLKRVNTIESEGVLAGENDTYFKYIRIKKGNTVLFNRRRPSGDRNWGKNIVNVNYEIPITITPNNIFDRYNFAVSIYDQDGGLTGNDDHLGSYSKDLHAGNLWGLKDNDGVYSERFQKVRALEWAVQPRINIKNLIEIEKRWGVSNSGKKTPEITYNQYATAFRDVDSDTEWWDITDWLKKAFYELVVKGIASTGNCFGFALESIYARKGSSLFSLPTNRFTDWSVIKNEINVKHCYQVGAAAIWWFLDQFISGNTHDPKDVFNETYREFRKGNHPVICVSKNYDFSGSPHCILPVAWDKSSKPWKITIYDPNAPTNLVRTLTVNPDNNTFEYKGSSTYRGGQWSGGRFHYMPFSVLNKPPRTPVWDAILLILAGTILILADDAETESITDEKGNDLNAYGDRAKRIFQSGGNIDNFFVGFNGFDSSISPGQILMRKENLAELIEFNKSNAPLAEFINEPKFSEISGILDRNENLKKLVIDRGASFLLNDPTLKTKLGTNARKKLENLSASNNNFIHRIKGKKNGKLNYLVKHQLNEIILETSLKSGEKHEINFSAIGTGFNLLKLKSERNKEIKISIKNKIGVTGDFIQIEMDKIPIDSNQQLELNVKTGIGGFELINNGISTNIPLTFNAKIQGNDVTKVFNAPFSNGFRIKPNLQLLDKELSISDIDRIFGQIISTLRIR